MMKDLQALMAKKGKKEMDPTYKDARKSMLGELQNAMSGEMADDVKGLKKVTVAAPDKSSLEHGLDKAKDMLGSKDDMCDECGEDHEGPHDPILHGRKLEDSDDAKEGDESAEEESEELADMDLSDDEIDQMMEVLKNKKMKNMMGK